VPVHDDFRRVEDVERLILLVRVNPNRPRLERELLRAQGLTHAHQRRTCFLANSRLFLLRGSLSRGYLDWREGDDAGRKLILSLSLITNASLEKENLSIPFRLSEN
jgi:hypothetical protein